MKPLGMYTATVREKPVSMCEKLPSIEEPSTLIEHDGVHPKVGIDM